MNSWPRSKSAKLLLTLMVLAIATTVHRALYSKLGVGVPFLFYYPAVVISGWLGGLWFGLLATVSAAVLAGYFFIPPESSMAISDPQSVLRLAIFLLSGILISFLSESLHQTGLQSFASETREKEQRERLHVILSSIGDAVIATDRFGRIEFMNGIAQTLTGWGQRDAVGKPLDEIFKIVNEETRENVDNPALLAMKQGVTFGLSNHTLLISRDGHEIPIDDSGAPVKASDGSIVGAVLIFRDISERRRDEHARTMLSYIVQSSDDAIISKSLEGIITSWNSAAERMFGWTSDEAVGKPITIVIPPDRLHEEKGILERLRRGERIDHFETIRISKDGRLMNISLTVSPIRDSTGRIIGASKIARDITQQKMAEQERTELLRREQAALAQSEAANLTKDQFLATASHELRTPLNAIFGWVRLLSTGTLDASGVTRAIETIEQSARAQARLIDDLLDVSRIASGKLQLNFELLDLGKIIRDAIETIRPIAVTKSIEIVTVVDRAAAMMTGDSTRLQQVIWNLLSNALKFTQNGGKVEVRLEKVDSQAQITVSDTGIGISEQFLPYLFEPFRQADGKDTRRHGGLGLGLAIVRHLVEMHGGTIVASSSGEGHGATFVVRLPLKAVAVHVLEQREKQASLPQLDKVKALVVDDEASARELMSAVLQKCGAEVVAVGSVPEALSAIVEWQPNVVVSDIAMPDQSGYDLITKIRALKPEQGGNIPAVAVTAYTKMEDRMKALAAGFQSHVAKPVEPGELALVVASLLHMEKQ